MNVRERWRLLVKRLLRRHGDVKSFDHEIEAMGGAVGSRDTGIQVVPTAKVVGSVSRWRNLRTDFFYKQGQAMTERFVRIGGAMRAGKSLPPLELYKVKARRPGQKDEVAKTEYYVVDGHHRVAMARKLGQDFLDARVVEYKVASPDENAASMPGEAADAVPTGGRDKQHEDVTPRAATEPSEAPPEAEDRRPGAQ